ncbi:SDR family oxidoreductase [Marinobacter nanhaiticus D15-8W]|uniref:SDR family oxidoreductase n=1 Tax=Marinobacter nanhaiticus D15-8W TaxID=626887 RepID=N6WZC5_9GAMM|nr:SDR family oxidoreductase [Marinobacter nanhaiticus]ENO16512.1 SDR family oxidoreductase [Marinobacter nanhaiticus D15-8W]BES72303.1 SDR family oxidoreductase [Marinobacter nanhaiticus D15-8W]
MTPSKGSPLKDPRTLYPKPEFPSQQQPIPGREDKMRPVPDHGEDSYRGTGKLEGCTALVTGADSGIGKAVALAYAREGADVAFTYLTEDQDARNTAELIHAEGRKALVIKMDQTDRKACDHVIQRVVDEFDGLDILVNNAAFQMSYEKMADIPDEEIKWAFSTNIEALFYLCRAALKHIPPGGSIINTTSIQAFKPSVNLAPYAATKAAIANFTLALAEEAIEQGVRVNGVAPGPVWTPLIPSTFPPEKVEGFGGNTLFGRPAQPAEVAPLYVFLASPAASFVAGEIYGVTGGSKQL